MNTQLIGWPSAEGGGRFEVIGRANARGMELPSIAFIRHTQRISGDITGAGTGTGADKHRKARAVGVGVDPDMARADNETELAARSAWVADLIREETELGRALMRLAGGREFADGQHVRLQGNGMAARAARYIKDRRGRTPSDTSLDDAAAAAALELVKQVAVWEYVLGIETLPAARVMVDVCIRSHLAGCAWRAAFRSLDGDASDGFTGRQAGEGEHSVPLALDQGQLESQRASLQAWARGERTITETAHDTTRRALCFWLWRSLVPTRTPGANAARTRDCARRRARFLIRLVHGHSWADAARLAGFADGAAASHSLAREQTWATLARAQAAETACHPIARALRAQWFKAARHEARARKAVRVWLNTSAPRGMRRKVTRGLLCAGHPGAGAMLVNHYAKDCAPRLSRKVRALGVDIGRAARLAIDQREQAARVTSGARARLVAFRERAAHSWQLASKGLRKGFLR